MEVRKTLNKLKNLLNWKYSSFHHLLKSARVFRYYHPESLTRRLQSTCINENTVLSKDNLQKCKVIKSLKWHWGKEYLLPFNPNNISHIRNKTQTNDRYWPVNGNCFIAPFRGVWCLNKVGQSQNKIISIQSQSWRILRVFSHTNSCKEKREILKSFDWLQ